MGQTRLLLASGSPRRRQFLETLGLSFEVHPAALDETPRALEPPRDYVARLAVEKAAAVARRFPDAVVLAADTTVVQDGQVLGKPGNEEEALAMLRALVGRAHQVLTGVALAGAGSGSVVVSTQVQMRAVSEEELRWYVRSGEPMDKAGAYAIQGIAGAFVERIEGSYSNVVGLPLAETLALLRTTALRLPWEAAR